MQGILCEECGKMVSKDNLRKLILGRLLKVKGKETDLEIATDINKIVKEYYLNIAKDIPVFPRYSEDYIRLDILLERITKGL